MPKAASGGEIHCSAPLNTLSKTEDDQAFADGIHGEILTHLTRIKEIKVKAQTSVLQYRDTKKSMRQIGQELGVSYLMKGASRRHVVEFVSRRSSLMRRARTISGQKLMKCLMEIFLPFRATSRKDCFSA